MDEDEFRDITFKLKQQGVTVIGADSQLTENNIMKLVNLVPLKEGRVSGPFDYKTLADIAYKDDSVLAFVNILYSSYFDYFLSINSYISTLFISLIAGCFLYYVGKKSSKRINFIEQLILVILVYLLSCTETKEKESSTDTIPPTAQRDGNEEQGKEYLLYGFSIAKAVS